jgi:hypothetical protein
VRRRRAARTVAAAAIVLALVVGSAVLLRPSPLTKQEYGARVSAAYADVREAFAATRGASGNTLAARVADAQTALREAADTLEDIDPPEDAEEPNDELVAGMRQYAADLDPLREAARRGDAAFQERFNRSVAQNPAVRRMAAAAQELEAKGYEIEGLGED